MTTPIEMFYLVSESDLKTFVAQQRAYHNGLNPNPGLEAITRRLVPLELLVLEDGEVHLNLKESDSGIAEELEKAASIIEGLNYVNTELRDLNAKLTKAVRSGAGA